ncbi:MAG TPA: M14 family metallopeptidase [Pseudomonadales bacterium]|nr:M14 family metallopeptidase [Pseudomonadales bacterium]
MSSISFDSYHDYEALTRILHRVAEEHPQLVSVASYGKSHEGRDLWVATVTNTATGPAEEKPAMLVDGNIHASEVIASMVALRHLSDLVDGYGTDEDVTRCLDTRAFYIIPRVSVDGAEQILGARPRFLRSSVRPYPFDDDPDEGLYAEDIDGDGQIMTMRVPDPNGRWKQDPDDPRLMIERGPIEEGGEYYRMLPEGRIHGFDGVTIRPQPPTQGLDLNRNWPSHWKREHEQQGAGPFPLSEPETHALASFVTAHPNIVTWIAGHSFTGVLLRAGFNESDESMPMPDEAHYKLVGEKGTALTGYPAISVFHDFRYGRENIAGSVGWGWDNLGIFLWAPEYWGPYRNAGVEPPHYGRWLFRHDIDDQRRMLKYSDEALGGQGFGAWKPFDHPELGAVEIGGWNLLRFLFNPPESEIDKETAPFSKWFTWQLLMSPRLAVRSQKAEAITDDTTLVQVVVENRGYLPSQGSMRALELKAVRGLIAQIELPEGASLVQGAARAEHGQLAGRAYRPSIVIGGLFSDDSSDRLKLEWVVRGATGRDVEIRLHHDKAGVVRTTLRC